MYYKVTYIIKISLLKAVECVTGYTSSKPTTKFKAYRTAYTMTLSTVRPSLAAGEALTLTLGQADATFTPGQADATFTLS